MFPEGGGVFKGNGLEAGVKERGVFVFGFVDCFLVNVEGFLVFFVFLEFEVKSGAVVVGAAGASNFLLKFEKRGRPPRDMSGRGFRLCVIEGVFFGKMLDL
jgi:hypothetical protein